MAILLLTAALGVQDGEVDRLIGRLADADIEVREQAQNELVKLGASARSKLESAIKTAEGELRSRIQQTLNGIARNECLARLKDSELAPALKRWPRVVDALAFGIPEQRGELVHVFGGYQRAGEGFRFTQGEEMLQCSLRVRQSLLLELLRSGLPESAQLEALFALHEINLMAETPALWSVPREWADALVTKSQSTKKSERLVAIAALGAIDGAEAEECLSNCVSMMDGDVRYFALRGLQGRRAIGRIDVVLPLLKTDDLLCRLIAVETLSRWGGERAERALLDHLRAGNHWSVGKTIAVKALVRWSVRGTADAVVDILQPDSVQDFSAAVEALAAVGKPKHAAGLIRILATRQAGDVRQPIPDAVIATLARIGTGEAVEELRKRLESADPESRTAAAALLVRAGQSVDGRKLLACLEENTTVQPWLLVSLNRCGRAAETKMRWSPVHTAVRLLDDDSCIEGVRTGFTLQLVRGCKRSAKLGEWLADLATATGLKAGIGIPEQELATPLELTWPLPEPSTEEMLVALARAGYVAVVVEGQLRLVSTDVAVRHWKDRLNR